MSYTAHGLIRELIYHVKRCSPEVRIERRMPRVDGYVAVYLPEALIKRFEVEADHLSKFESECE
jgi:hypothetical protein